MGVTWTIPLGGCEGYIPLPLPQDIRLWRRYTHILTFLLTSSRTNARASGYLALSWCDTMWLCVCGGKKICKTLNYLFHPNPRNKWDFTHLIYFDLYSLSEILFTRNGSEIYLFLFIIILHKIISSQILGFFFVCIFNDIQAMNVQ